jgi:hypothetical protein
MWLGDSVDKNLQRDGKTPLMMKKRTKKSPRLLCCDCTKVNIVIQGEEDQEEGSMTHGFMIRILHLKLRNVIIQGMDA